MSVALNGIYMGENQVSITHEDSQTSIKTDAPKDNQGLGRTFSPTDLFATSLASCIMTIMALKAQNSEDMPSLDGSTFSVSKHMASNPRRIGKIEAIFNLPSSLNEKQRNLLELAAKACPVHASISPQVELSLEFRYVTD